MEKLLKCPFCKSEELKELNGKNYCVKCDAEIETKAVDGKNISIKTEDVF